MTRNVLLSTVAVLLGSLPGFAADTFAGKWVNVDEETRSITRLEIEERGAAWAIQAWGRCHPTDCDWGETPLHLLGDSVDDKVMKYGFAHWNKNFCETYMVLDLKNDELLVETHVVFRDASGRSNYRSKVSFKRAE